MGKRPGKTGLDTRRRTVTRRAGFSSHPDSTGGEYRATDVPLVEIGPDAPIEIAFKFPIRAGQFAGFGFWFTSTSHVQVSLDKKLPKPLTKSDFPCPNWNKVGSMWRSDSDGELEVTITLESLKKGEVALFGITCGAVSHRHLDSARSAILENMHIFSPEALFVEDPGSAAVNRKPDSASKTTVLHRKSCNRCARFLPINIENERAHLSFSNHCVAKTRRPCKHSGFGRLTDVDTDREVRLEYGFQLECRFCKKFEVNAAHNPQRTADQMKEDATRRRYFEHLLTRLNGESKALSYRIRNSGKELSTGVWEKFEKKCFNCEKSLKNTNVMHLDHTRPLALLWPLDETATSLCGSCNSSKRDRYPNDFYSNEKLRKLAKITGISYEELKSPSPNVDAIDRLGARLDWFFEEFCADPRLLAIKDGKRALDLLLKALQKALDAYPGGAPFNVSEEYEKWKKLNSVSA